MSLKNRKLNRLKDYDYSEEGYYYVTICTKKRIDWFGTIKNDEMLLNDCGKNIVNYWEQIPRYYKYVELDEFIVMPDHLHGILAIVGTAHCAVPTKVVSISQIIKSFKDVTTKHIRTNYGAPFSWQRSFYDHIIRNDRDLSRVREYIKYNAIEDH